MKKASEIGFARGLTPRDFLCPKIRLFIIEEMYKPWYNDTTIIVGV